MPHGPGYFTWPNGSSFKGSWAAGRREGPGLEQIIVDDGMDICRGVYRKDKKHGHCMVFYANGDTFSGEFKDNEKNGKGRYTYSDGLV